MSTSEEEFFYQQNKELIEERRKINDQKRKEREEQERKETHWMRCPKCGHEMKEVNLKGILIDKCTNCHGIYFDHGELETLLQSEQQKGFFGCVQEVMLRFN